MTDAEGLVEAMCRAICVAEGHNPDMVYAINATGSMIRPLADVAIPMWMNYRERVGAVLSAISAAGWQVVPVEPTKEMLTAGATALADSETYGREAKAGAAYEAMTAEAPTVPS